MPYLMGGFPDMATSRGRDRRLRRHRRRPDRARRALLRSARRRPADPRRRRRRRSRPARRFDGVLAALRARLRAGPGAADGLRERRPDARRRAVRAPRSTAPARPGRSSPTCRASEDPSSRRGAARARARADRVRVADDVARAAAPRSPRGAVGFIYVVSLTGVTGERDGAAARSSARWSPPSEARPMPPPRSGSGSGRPSRRRRSARIADGVIIGTRLVRAVADRPRTTACGGRRRRGSAFMADTRTRPVDFAPMQLLGFLAAGDVRLHRSASRSISAAPSCAMIFLLILFIGALLRAWQPLIEWARGPRLEALAKRRTAWRSRAARGRPS